jgi:hypothetical protein
MTNERKISYHMEVEKISLCITNVNLNEDNCIHNTKDKENEEKDKNEITSIPSDKNEESKESQGTVKSPKEYV